jgi:hypothetical protein
VNAGFLRQRNDGLGWTTHAPKFTSHREYGAFESNLPNLTKSAAKVNKISPKFAE